MIINKIQFDPRVVEHRAKLIEQASSSVSDRLLRGDFIDLASVTLHTEEINRQDAHEARRKYPEASDIDYTLENIRRHCSVSDRLLDADIRRLVKASLI